MLNRVIRWESDRITYDADPRQAERLVAECGLAGATPVVTPGVKPTFLELEDDTPLPQRLTTAFRSAGARGNYFSADRIDLQFACKEVCRWMAKPTEHAWRALKRICRYLSGMPRFVYKFEQQSVSSIDVYTDTDWAGCPKTRKSTSGGCVMFGKHAMKQWFPTPGEYRPQFWRGRICGSHPRCWARSRVPSSPQGSWSAGSPPSVDRLYCGDRHLRTTTFAQASPP